jgi:hypothetical protein
MSIDDPNSWMQGAAAFKSIFEGLRSAIGLVREVGASNNSSDAEKYIVEEALTKAARASEIAEAEIAKALGYELCKCRFPPVAMLTVGRGIDRKSGRALPVYECPVCGYNTGGGIPYKRTVPKEDTSEQA